MSCPQNCSGKDRVREGLQIDDMTIPESVRSEIVRLNESGKRITTVNYCYYCTTYWYVDYVELGSGSRFRMQTRDNIIVTKDVGSGKLIFPEKITKILG